MIMARVPTTMDRHSLVVHPFTCGGGCVINEPAYTKPLRSPTTCTCTYMLANTYMYKRKYTPKYRKLSVVERNLACVPLVGCRLSRIATAGNAEFRVHEAET